MDQEKIGLFIKQLRNELKMTQADLAKKLNVTDRAVSKWERGKGLPDISLLEDLSEIFGVSILEILRGEKQEQEEVKESILLDILKYAKEDKKNFISNTVNIVCLVIIILIGFSLGVKNIRSIYYQNKKYGLNYYVDYEYNIVGSYNAVKRDIELIRKHQGKYTDEDYKVILEMIDKFEKSLNYNLDKEILDKRDFNLKEISSYASKLNSDFYGNDVDNLIIILLKYDNSIYKDFKNIDHLYLEYNGYYSAMNMENEVYYYNFEGIESVHEGVSSLRKSISSKYKIIEKVLTKIINVGDIHE